MQTSIHKCRCGDPICDQLSTQGSVGFDLKTATLYAAADDMLEALRVFAACADEIDYEDANHPERTEQTPDEEWARFRLTAGDYRKAREALKKATSHA